MQVRKQQLELDIKKETGFKSRKEYTKAVYSQSCEMLGWMKLEFLIPKGNINNLRYADDTTIMAESEEELKSFFMKIKGRVEKLA